MKSKKGMGCKSIPIMIKKGKSKIIQNSGHKGSLTSGLEVSSRKTLKLPTNPKGNYSS
jgi:hypothetical protein